MPGQVCMALIIIALYFCKDDGSRGMVHRIVVTADGRAEVEAEEKPVPRPQMVSSKLQPV